MRHQVLLAAALLLPAAARAEDYVDLSVGSVNYSDAIRSLSLDGWNLFVGGRYDLPPRYPAVFLTADMMVHRVSSNDAGTNTRDGLGRYDVGAGYAWLPDNCSEVYVRADYYHFELSSDSTLRSYDSNTDGVHGAVGGYYWVTDWLKPYAEAGWIRESRDIDGPRGSIGVEGNFNRHVRPFLDYSYTHENAPAGTIRYSVLSLGIKVPFQ